MERRIRALTAYLRGWMQYFQLARTPSVYRHLDGWTLRPRRSVAVARVKHVRSHRDVAKDFG